MEWAVIINELFTVVLIPLLGILVKYFVQFVNTKSAELKQSKDDATFQKYIQMLNDTITNVVTSTNQTYVDSLKAQGKFDAEAQKKAFEMSYNTILSILGEEVRTYLSEVLGDLDEYIRTAIERQVSLGKLIPSTING